MRRIGTLLWLVVLGFTLYNGWQIQELRHELEAQRAAVRISERSTGIADKMQRALERGGRARRLLERGRYSDAAAELDRAMAEMTDAAKATDSETAERLRQVQNTLSKVRDQAQSLLRRVTPGGEKTSSGG